MDVLIEDIVLYRDRKRWMKRYCKLVRTNTFSDSVKLLVCAVEDVKTKRAFRKPYTTVLSKHVIYGHLHGIHMGNQSYVMYIVCKCTVECLAFEDFETMKLWSDILGQHLHDISQFVDLIHSDKHSQLKGKIEGRLFFNCSHISFIRSPSTCEPKLLMSWKIADVMEYGCRNTDKQNSVKNKLKNNFSDDSQNLFIMKVSPMCPRAPNVHIFSCNDPKKFCVWMENLASNQLNILSPKCCEVLTQRLRNDSYSTILRSRENSESSSELDQSNDSAGLKTLKFFPDYDSFRPPRYQRSCSEVRQYRHRLTSDNDIPEKEELVLNEPKILSLPEGVSTMVESDITTRSSTVTWLERYPFEKERCQKNQLFHRQMSEGASTVNFSGSTPPSSTEFTLPRPKSSNNYCSLLNLRPLNDISSNTSPLYQTSTLSSSINISREHGLPTSRYVNLSGSSGYANLQLNQLIHEISDYCTVGNGSAASICRHNVRTFPKQHSQ